MSPEKQERLLNKCPEIVVATPGRMWEMIQKVCKIVIVHNIIKYNIYFYNCYFQVDTISIIFFSIILH